MSEVTGTLGGMAGRRRAPLGVAPALGAPTACTAPGCGAPIMWLRSAATGRPAAIDRYPTEGGNITVDLTAGTYTVLPKDEARREAEADALFGDLSVQMDTAPAQPRVHVNHFATCGSPTAKRLAAEAAGRAPVTTLDGPAAPPRPGDRARVAAAHVPHVNHCVACGTRIPRSTVLAGGRHCDLHTPLD